MLPTVFGIILLLSLHRITPSCKVEAASGRQQQKGICRSAAWPHHQAYAAEDIGGLVQREDGAACGVVWDAC